MRTPKGLTPRDTPPAGYHTQISLLGPNNDHHRHRWARGPGQGQVVLLVRPPSLDSDELVNMSLAILQMHSLHSMPKCPFKLNQYQFCPSQSHPTKIPTAGETVLKSIHEACVPWSQADFFFVPEWASQ